MTPPFPRLSGRRDAQATRERLLAAALDLFTTVGFRATTTPMLAERAGVAEGTIYRHFSGKDALLNAVHARVQAWALGVVTAPESSGIARAPDRLNFIGRALAEEGARNPAIVRMLLLRGDERYLDDASRDAAAE
ncbi:MAG: TetR/AcrR family transcriptional regulator, partial [Gemmatimonadales bacterium]|nr:TetR/AcrR family transcriptional regulator [Gemmatimonadales bacterium]